MDEEFLSEEEIHRILNHKYLSEYRVYFNKDDGAIYALSNEWLPEYDTSIEVKFETIERFWGPDNFINFKVIIDADGEVKFINKNESDLVFKSNIIEGIRLTDLDTNVLTIVWTTAGWEFIVHERFLTHPRAKSLNARLFFYVTKEDNINVLIRKIDVQLRNLLSNGTLVIPFETEEEKLIDNISMFTLPFFESYGMKIKND